MTITELLMLSLISLTSQTKQFIWIPWYLETRARAVYWTKPVVLSWGEDGWSVSFLTTIESYPFQPDFAISKVAVSCDFRPECRVQQSCVAESSLRVILNSVSFTDQNAGEIMSVLSAGLAVWPTADFRSHQYSPLFFLQFLCLLSFEEAGRHFAIARVM